MSLTFAASRLGALRSCARTTAGRPDGSMQRGIPGGPEGHGISRLRSCACGASDPPPSASASTASLEDVLAELLGRAGGGRAG